uniref:EGF-like domain-containing protein n=1 Tax=Neogobius melanostomus TaxID=47308 RepID=A0A8C6TZ93_9GOBI
MNVQSEQNTITEDEAGYRPFSVSEIPVLSTETTTEQTDSPNPQPKQRPSLRANAIRRNAEEAVTVPIMETVRTTGQSEVGRSSQSDDGKRTEARDKDLNQNLKPGSNHLPEGTERTAPQFDHRAGMKAYAMYHHRSPHLPGDLLFEVSVEVNVSRDSEPFNDVAQTLLLSVKTLIRNQLKPALVSLSVSSKRIKRLNGGVLFILWLQIGQRMSGHHTHEVVHSSLQRLIGSGLGFRQNQDDSVIMSLSTADVNECDSQLVMCDPNADCVNHFGSYSCQCRTDFEDQSRSGTGTVCVDMKNIGCSSSSSSSSSEAKAVYILFFLLSTLVLSLLIFIGLFYLRHRRGFFVPPSDPNNNNIGSSGHRDDIDMPPPPPPRCPRWTCSYYATRPYCLANKRPERPDIRGF